jgi:hypothetical protein
LCKLEHRRGRKNKRRRGKEGKERENKSKMMRYTIKRSR